MCELPSGERDCFAVSTVSSYKLSSDISDRGPVVGSGAPVLAAVPEGVANDTFPAGASDEPPESVDGCRSALRRVVPSRKEGVALLIAYSSGMQDGDFGQMITRRNNCSLSFPVHERALAYIPHFSPSFRKQAQSSPEWNAYGCASCGVETRNDDAEPDGGAGKERKVVLVHPDRPSESKVASRTSRMRANLAERVR